MILPFTPDYAAADRVVLDFLTSYCIIKKEVIIVQRLVILECVGLIIQ